MTTNRSGQFTEIGAVAEDSRTVRCPGRVTGLPLHCTKPSGHEPPCLYEQVLSAPVPSSVEAADAVAAIADGKDEPLGGSVNCGGSSDAMRAAPTRIQTEMIMKPVQESAVKPEKVAVPPANGRREALPWLLREAAVDPGGFGPTDLAALLEEAAQEIAYQNNADGVASEADPMRHVVLSSLDLEEAIQEWVGERYGFLEGWWKATANACNGPGYVKEEWKLLARALGRGANPESVMADAFAMHRRQTVPDSGGHP